MHCKGLKVHPEIPPQYGPIFKIIVSKTQYSQLERSGILKWKK